MIHRLCHIIWILSLACFACQPNQPSSTRPEAQIRSVEASKNLGNYETGKKVYMTHCVFCHGEQADGKGYLAVNLGPPAPRDFRLPILAATHPDTLKHVILKGGAANGLSDNMPAWEGTLLDDEVTHVIAFIQTVSRNGGLLPEHEESVRVTDATPSETHNTH